MAEKPEPFAMPVGFGELEQLLPELERRAGSGLGFSPSSNPPTFDPLAGELYRVAHECGAICKDFDWAAYADGVELYFEPGTIERADLVTCRKLLTIIVRQERLVGGSLSGHIESGFAARLVKRIAVARRTPPAGMIDVAEDMLADEERVVPTAFLARPRPPCPSCGSESVIPIVRGEPTQEAEEAARRGECLIGGCLVFDESTLWSCRACRHEFGRFADLVRPEKGDG